MDNLNSNVRGDEIFKTNSLMQLTAVGLCLKGRLYTESMLKMVTDYYFREEMNDLAGDDAGVDCNELYYEQSQEIFNNIEWD